MVIVYTKAGKNASVFTGSLQIATFGSGEKLCLWELMTTINSPRVEKTRMIGLIQSIGLLYISMDWHDFRILALCEFDKKGTDKG